MLILGGVALVTASFFALSGSLLRRDREAWLAARRSELEWEAFDPSELLFEESDPDSDARYAVDIFVVCPTAQDVVAGVQVKPESYQRTSLRVRSQNQEKNRAFGKPVHYLHYTPTGYWQDMDQLTHALRARPPQ